MRRLVSTLRFIARALRPSTWRVVLRAALPTARASAQYKDLTLEIFDLRPRGSRNLEQLTKLVTEALQRLSAAGQGFGELVTSHLHSVLALPPGRKGASWSARAYGSTFEGPEGKSPQLLASRLVGAATIIRLMRDAEASGRRLEDAQLKRASSEALRRFLLQFDNAEEWVAYMGINDDEASPGGGAV